MLPLLPEHVFFEYACFRLGIIFCPLDVRLKRDELIRCIKFLKDAPRIGFIHPDDTESTNKRGEKKFYPFKQYARAIREECPFVKDFIQFSTVEDVDPNSGTEGVLEYTKDMKRTYLNLKKNSSRLKHKLKEIEDLAAKVKEDDAILIIYTTLFKTHTIISYNCLTMFYAVFSLLFSFQVRNFVPKLRIAIQFKLNQKLLQ